MSNPGIEGKRFVDKPETKVFAIHQEITCEQAREIGRMLGAAGYTATFAGGTLAGTSAEGIRARQQREAKEEPHG